MWMKAMCSDWNAGSAEIRYFAAVKLEHKNTRMGGLIRRPPSPCYPNTVYVKAR